MSWDIFSKSKIQYFLEKLKGKFVQKETGKGLSTNDFDNTYKSKVDKIDVSSTSVSGNPISISGLKANQLAKNPIITLEPIQDLHGQSKPYPAGGGKNKLPMTVQGIKDANTSGTWSSNAYTYNGITYTILTDNASNVIGIRVNGTASADSYFMIGGEIQNFLTDNAKYDFSGCPSGGDENTYHITIGATYSTARSGFDVGSGTTFTYTSAIATRKLFIVVKSGTVILNKDFYPQIEEGNSKTPFAPYSNICPISGYDKIEVLSVSKNIWGEDWEVGAIDNNTGQNNNSDLTQIRVKGYILVAPNTTYAFSCPNTSIRIYWYDIDKTFISSASIPNSTAVSPSNAHYLRLRSTGSYGNTYKNDIMVTCGNDASVAYEPSVKTTDISESLGQTVYGGTLDVRTGVLTVDRKIVDMGDLTWSAGTGFYYTNSATDKLMGRSAAQYAENPMIACSCFATITDLFGSEANSIRSGYTGASNYEDGRLIIFASGYATGEAFKTAMTGQKIVYPLATPFTIQLTPHEISLLKDYAYLSTNGTTIALDYHNGELASLADVSQLGETVNELGEYVGTITDNNYVNCSACSTIASIFETIMQGQSKLKSTAYGVGNIGALQNTNLKTLLGNPDLTNYVHAYIRPIVSGTNFMKLAEVYAVSTVNTQFAIKRKYIWISQSSASQSAWETINYMT